MLTVAKTKLATNWPTDKLVTDIQIGLLQTKCKNPTQIQTCSARFQLRDQENWQILTSLKHRYQTCQRMDLQHYIEQIEEWLCIKAKKHTIIVQACIWIRRMQEDKILALRVRMIDLQENAPDNWIYTIQIMRRQNHPNWHMFSLQVIAAANKANIFSTTMSIVILSSYHIVNNQIRKWDGHDMIINNY